MENSTPYQPSKARMAAVVALFIGMQALFVVGSYYYPHYSAFAALADLSRTQQLHITIWVVLAANVLVFVVGALLRRRQLQPAG